MSRREKLFWLFAAAVIVASLSFLIPFHGEICKEGAKSNNEGCASYGLLPFVFVQIAKALDAAGAAVTAVATIAIAWFTWTLRRSTDRLWDAGERQIAAGADAFNKLNRPYVFVFGVKDVMPGPNENLDGFVPYVIANHGQSPALIERVEYSLAPGAAPQDTNFAWDDHPLVVSPVIGIAASIEAEANSAQWIDSGQVVVTLPSEALKESDKTFRRGKTVAIPEIKIPGTTWYFWVKVLYRGPFSLGHETSACWSYDLETCQFVQYGGAAYNYTK